MTKVLKMSFTGSAILTPAYPTDLSPIDGPLTALMPGARRVRRSTFEDQINAQFTFVVFPYRHLVHESQDERDADYKYPDIKNVTTGLVFLEREEMRIEAFVSDRPNGELPNGIISFDTSPSTGTPSVNSTGAGYIARWEDFAAGGNSRVVWGLHGEGDFVRIIIPAGEVSSGFVGEPIARINFDYGQDSPTKAYAQKIVVTMFFDDVFTDVTLNSTVFGGGPRDPYKLRFRWYDKSSIELLFANASLESMLNVLRGSFVGQDHEGDYDLEFEVLYDPDERPNPNRPRLIHVRPDAEGRLPLPQIRSLETLRVPCIASMITSSPEALEVAPESDAVAKDAATIDAPIGPREPGQRRRNGGNRG